MIARALAVLAGIAQAPVHAQTLRIGLAEDPDILDPTLARTFVGRIVFAALCDKLVDIDENLKIVPQLATGWEWAPDNKSIVFKLRPGVTARQAVASLKQLASRAPGFSNINCWMWDGNARISRVHFLDRSRRACP